jgi:hypothetical protein
LAVADRNRGSRGRALWILGGASGGAKRGGGRTICSVPANDFNQIGQERAESIKINNGGSGSDDLLSEDLLAVLRILVQFIVRVECFAANFRCPDVRIKEILYF